LLSLKRPGRLWGPPTWGMGFFSGAYSGRGMKLTTHFRLTPRLTMSGVIPLLSLPVRRVTWPALLLRFARGAKILGTRSTFRLNFVRRNLNTGGSSVWKLHRVTVLAPIILRVSTFVTNCGPLLLTITGHLQPYAASRVGDRLSY
jgi:hypothetical protein